MRLFVLALVLGQFSLGLCAFASPDVQIDLKAEQQKEQELIEDVLRALSRNKWGFYPDNNLARFVIKNLSNRKVLAAVVDQLFNKEYQDDKLQNYRYAVEVLGSAKPEYILPAYVECYRAGKKICSAMGLAYMGKEYPDTLQVLTETTLTHKSAKERRSALSAIVQFRSMNKKLTAEQQQQIANVIRDRFEKDSDWLIRYDAAKGFMWEPTRQQGFEYLTKAMKTEKDARIISQMILVLKQYKGPSDDKFNDEHFEKVKKMALDANLADDDRATATYNLRELGVALKRENDAFPALMQVHETSQSDAVQFMVLVDIWAYTDYLRQQAPAKREEYMSKLRRFINGLATGTREHFLEHLEGMEKQLAEK